jgi:AICAR transformylase/IMP cyclohydrolase PurH
LPTLFLFGGLRDQDGNKKQISIGAGSANHIEDTDAKAELLEFTGAGMKSIKDDIDDKVATMASIGAKALANGGGGVKSAETAQTADTLQLMGQVFLVRNFQKYA